MAGLFLEFQALLDEIAGLRLFTNKNIPFQWENDPGFKIAVIGEASSGKSALVNRIIGLNVSPTDVLPGTTPFPLKFAHGANELRVKFTDDSERILSIPANGSLADELANAARSGNVSEIECFLNNISEFLNIYDTPAIDGANGNRALAIAQKCDLIFITTNLAASPLSSPLMHFTNELIKNENTAKIFTGTFADKFDCGELARLNAYMEKKLKNFFGSPQKILFTALPPGREARAFLPESGQGIALAAFINEFITARLREKFEILNSALNALVAELAGGKEKLQKQASLQAKKIEPNLTRNLQALLAGFAETFRTYAEKELDKFHSRLEKRIKAYKTSSGLAAFGEEKLPREFAAFTQDFNAHFSAKMDEMTSIISQRCLPDKNTKERFASLPFFYLAKKFSSGFSEKWNDGHAECLPERYAVILQDLLDDLGHEMRETIKINIEQIETFFLEGMENRGPRANGTEAGKNQQLDETYARILQQALNLQKMLDEDLESADFSIVKKG